MFIENFLVFPILNNDGEYTIQHYLGYQVKIY